MYNYTSDWSDKAVGRFIRNVELTREDLENWQEFPVFRLRLADRISRGLEPVTQKQLDFIERLKEYFK
jgi:hypothetical protein